MKKQNEAALRIAKQQQELELECLQQEQEYLRIKAERQGKNKHSELKNYKRKTGKNLLRQPSLNSN